MKREGGRGMGKEREEGGGEGSCRDLYSKSQEFLRKEDVWKQMDKELGRRRNVMGWVSLRT